MQIENITLRTKRMIDDLKTICANFGLGGSPGEYKIITQVFLYKYLSDKFLYEAKKADPTLANVENIEEALSAMPDDQYEMLGYMLGGSTAKLKKTHYISYLFNHQNDETMRKADGSIYPFHELFDDTLVDIANYNLDIFSVQTGGEKRSACLILFLSMSLRALRNLCFAVPLSINWWSSALPMCLNRNTISLRKFSSI